MRALILASVAAVVAAPAFAADTRTDTVNYTHDEAVVCKITSDNSGAVAVNLSTGTNEFGVAIECNTEFSLLFKDDGGAEKEIYVNNTDNVMSTDQYTDQIVGKVEFSSGGEPAVASGGVGGAYKAQNVTANYTVTWQDTGAAREAGNYTGSGTVEMTAVDVLAPPVNVGG